MPFKSKAQRRWMYANHPEMAARWEEHTQDKDLPEKVDEGVTPFDDPDLDADEAEEIAVQLGDYVVDDGDDDEEEITPPPPPKPVTKPKFSMASMMKKAITAAPVPQAAPEEVPDIEEPPQSKSITMPPPKRKRGSYSPRRKLATLGRPKDVWSSDYIDLRQDIEDFADKIKEYRDGGANAAQIARQINDDFGLAAPPRSELPRGRGRPSEKEVPCPQCGTGTLQKGDATWNCDNGECGFEMVRKLTPSDVANYLKSIGDITIGAASTPEDLGSKVPHNHSDPGEWHADCPACTFSTSFDSEWEYPPHVVDALKNLGEFSTEEAIQAVRGLPEFEDKRVGGYSDTTLPGGYKNIGDLVKQVLRGSGQFEPTDPNWSKLIFTPAANRLRWRYVGGDEDQEIADLISGLEEGTRMGDRYCPSCEEGNHHRCRSESCGCCGGNAIREMFEAANRPVGSQPFQDWTKLGTVGTELKRQADTMKGASYQTQDGKILFYKDQMGTGEQPLMADVTKGVWTQDPTHPSQGMGSMQSVFTPKTTG